MRPEDLLRKSGKGQEALKARSAGLPPRLRSLLIMVDGRQNVAWLRDAGIRLGAPDDAIERLLADGFVEPMSGSRSGEPSVLPTSMLPSSMLPPSALPSSAMPSSLGGSSLGGASVLASSLPPAVDAATVDAGSPGTAPAPGDMATVQQARKLMNDIVVDQLGVRAVFFTLKIERCFGRDDLIALLPEFERQLAKGKGPDHARRQALRVRNLLG